GLARRNPLGEVRRDARRRDPERGLPARPGGARARGRRCRLARRADGGRAAGLDELLAACVEGADAWRKRGIEVLAKQREDGDVTKRSCLARRQPPPQRRLLDEAELARDAEARLVARLDADLDPVGLADLEPRTRERRGRLGCDPLPRCARPDPVADLEPARPDSRVEPGAAEDLRFVGAEDPAREVGARVEVGAELLDERGLVLERLRL